LYICYDRHFPDGARALGLNGAEIVYNPSATVAGLSEYLWKLEQPAHAAANGYFMGCINRVGEEKPWNLGKFYGQSYFVDPRGQIFSQALAEFYGEQRNKISAISPRNKQERSLIKSLFLSDFSAMTEGANKFNYGRIQQTNKRERV